MLWSKPINKKIFDFEGNSWGAGPRATPTVAGGMIFALAGDGELAAVDVDGNLKWRVNMVDDLGGSISIVDAGEPETYGWGYCWAPLVDDDKVICVPGGDQGMIAALDVGTGKVLWRSERLKGGATYASPIQATVDGVEQYIVMPQGGITGECSDCASPWRICNKTVIIQREFANDRYDPVITVVIVGETLGL